jgi:hypothetical protein
MIFVGVTTVSAYLEEKPKGSAATCCDETLLASLLLLLLLLLTQKILRMLASVSSNDHCLHGALFVDLARDRGARSCRWS